MAHTKAVPKTANTQFQFEGRSSITPPDADDHVQQHAHELQRLLVQDERVHPTSCDRMQDDRTPVDRTLLDRTPNDGLQDDVPDNASDTSPPPSYHEAMLDAHVDVVSIPHGSGSIPHHGSIMKDRFQDNEVPSYEESIHAPFLPQHPNQNNIHNLSSQSQLDGMSTRSINSLNVVVPNGLINSSRHNSISSTSFISNIKCNHNIKCNNSNTCSNINSSGGDNNTEKTEKLDHHQHDNLSVHTYGHSDYQSAFSSGVHTPLQPCSNINLDAGPPTFFSNAPDGGYGWIVCLASFLIMIILDGMLFSFGVFFLDLLEYFQEGKGKTALVGSTLMGTHLIVGPFTSALVNLWGCRAVAMTGAVVATLAFAASISAPSIEVLIFTYGILGGIGVSMIYIPTILIVGFYFDKRRALANGLSASGSGVGAFLYAPLCRLLQDHYGWRGALLILAGLVFNCLALAALFRPLNSDRSPESEKSDESTTCTSDDDEKPILPPKKISTSSKTNLPHDGQMIKRIHLANINKVEGGNLSLSSIPNKLSLNHVNMERLSPLVTGSANNLAPVLPSKFNTQPEQCFLSMVAIPVGNSQIISQSHHNLKHRHYKGASERPLDRKDLFYSGSVYRINSTCTDIYPGSSKEDPSQCKKDKKRKMSFQEFLEGMRIIVGLSLLKKPILLLTILMGVLWTTHASVLTILPNYATMSGVSKFRAGFLLSIVGISNILGRLCAGFLADRLDCVKINMVALFTGGLVNLMIPFFTNYYMLAGLSTIFGLCMGTWTSLRPIVLVNLLGLDRLTNAFGLMAMFQGGAFCIGSPIAGVLFDYTNSYRIPFLIAGVAFILSGLLCIPLRMMGNRERNNNGPGLDIVVS